MKIIRKYKIPKAISLKKPLKDQEMIEKTEEIEIPDKLLLKAEMVIYELLDRTYDEWEERSWTQLEFPLVPFPFFQKSRLPENATGDAWIGVWLETTLQKNIMERAEIVYKLNRLEAISIEEDAVIDMGTGQFRATAFLLSIDRGKLQEIRKKISDELQKQKRNSKELHPEEITYEQALFVLREVYNKIVEILSGFCEGYVIVRDSTLNMYYTIMLETARSILGLKGFEQLKEEFPELLESLVGNVEDVDINWQHGMQQQVFDFLGKIEKRFILSGAKGYELPYQLQENLKNTDRAMSELKKQKKEFGDRLWKDAERLKEQINPSVKKSGEEAESANGEIVFEADIKDEYAVWKKGEKEKMWNMKKKTNGEFFEGGKDMLELLKNLGKPLIERERRNNIITGMAGKLDLPKKEIEKIFFNKEGKYGVKESYFKLVE